MLRLPVGQQGGVPPGVIDHGGDGDGLDVGLALPQVVSSDLYSVLVVPAVSSESINRILVTIYFNVLDDPLLFC